MKVDVTCLNISLKQGILYIFILHKFITKKRQKLLEIHEKREFQTFDGKIKFVLHK